MMSFTVQQLNARSRATLVAHFLALPMRDRALRFGMSLAPTVIGTYVERIDFDHDAVFGMHDDRFALVAAAHLAVEDERAELGLSVLPPHRGRGIGSALFKCAMEHARDRGIPKLFMQCLSGNAPIMRIAQKFGMEIIEGGGNADAHLRLHPAPRAMVALERGAPVEFRPGAVMRETHETKMLCP